MRLHKSSLGGGATLVLVAGLTACGSSGSGSSGSSSAVAKTSGTSSASSSSSSPSSSSAAGSASSTPSASGGEAGKSATQVLADAKSALFNATSVHVSGTVTQQGQQEKLDLRFQGNNTSGTETIQSMVVNIVKIGSTAYIKAPATFWTKAAGSKAAGLAGKWIKSTGTNNALNSLTLQSLAASINTSDSPLDPHTKQTMLDGKKVVLLTQKDGSTLYVAEATPPVPVRIVNMSTSTKGQLTFADYGATQHITAPSGAVTAQQALKGHSTTT